MFRERDVKLTDEERVYLNAAALGDVPIVRQSVGETKSNNDTLNVNCVDYMGRSALHLAVDSESMETVELLLDCVNFECIEESLLHAISKGATKIVKVTHALHSLFLFPNKYVCSASYGVLFQKCSLKLETGLLSKS